MKETLIHTLIILAISALSFYWMMSGNYLISFETIAPDASSLSNSNFFVKLLAILFFGILWIIIALFSCVFALFWPIGAIMAIVTFFGGSFKALFGKSKITNSKYRNSSNDNYSQSNKNYANSTYNVNQHNFDSTRAIIPGQSGEFYNHKTGKFQKENILGLNNNTGNSVDKNSGKFQRENVLGLKTETGRRIDFETGKIYTRDLIGEKETGTRINQTTGVIEKKGLFGYSKTDERINPETGKREVKDLIGWKEKK